MKDIVGHESQIRLLKTLLTQKRVPQALIFSGPRQVGKSSIANSFVTQLLCQNQIGNDACISCVTPLSQHPDYMEILRTEEENQVSVAQLKRGLQHLYQSPLLARKKIVIIPKAEHLSHEGSNALLKTIEDPKENRHIILITTDLYSILPTVRSRCMIIPFYPLNTTTIADLLISRGVESSLASSTAQLAAGRPGLALQSITQRVSALEADLEQLPELIRDAAGHRFAIVERIHKRFSNLPTSEVRDVLTQMAQKWQNIFLKWHRQASQAEERAHFIQLATFCEVIPTAIRSSVSARTVLELFITR